MNTPSLSKQKVVIIGHSSTLRLGIVRAIAELGCEITVVVLTGASRLTKRINTRKPFDCYSRYITNVHYCLATDSEALILLLINKCKDSNQKVILIPTSDISALAVDANKNQLDEHFLFPFIMDSSKSISYWMDKERQKNLAREIGLNVTDSHIINIKNKTYELPIGINYPCFTKALASIKGAKNCFNRCNNQLDLCNAIDSIKTQKDLNILVEDFIEIETEYAVLGFSNGNDVIIPGIVQIERLSKSHFGVAATGKIIPVTGFETLLEQFKIFVCNIGFVGIFDIDFFYSNGKYYFGEMNLRPGGSGYAITKLGINLPIMLVQHLRGEIIQEIDKQQITTSTSFVNERMCEEDWRLGYISSQEYHHLLSQAEISFIADSDDPDPKKNFISNHKRIYKLLYKVKKIAKKFLKRP